MATVVTIVFVLTAISCGFNLIDAQDYFEEDYLILGSVTGGDMPYLYQVQLSTGDHRQLTLTSSYAMYDGFYPYSMRIDPATKDIYYGVSNSMLAETEIMVLHWDTKTTSSIAKIPGSLIGIAIDSDSRVIYYTDDYNGLIGKLTIDTGVYETITQNLMFPNGLAFDKTTNTIYWCDGLGIYKRGIDDIFGLGNVAVLSGTGLLTTFNVDFNTGDIYFSVEGSRKVEACDLEGNNRRDIFNDPLNYPFQDPYTVHTDTTLDCRYLYYVDYSTRYIRRLDRVTSQITTLATSSIDFASPAKLDVVTTCSNV